jgi:hypothetical protein
MGYSNDYKIGGSESNSVSLAMFASVGFHAVLFTLMAFFPAASETVEKPLRIVNLLPPSQTGSPQAKTSTLEDILQNPLPDLSAGFPPLGNEEIPPNQTEPNTSSYFGDRTNTNRKINTGNLKPVNPPNRSFPLGSANSSQSGSSNPSNSQNSPSPPSNILPAPNTPFQNLPPLDGAGPPPTGTVLPEKPRDLNSQATATRNIPPSREKIVPIISATVPHSYPAAACPNALQGTATLEYYRQPDGSYVAGSAKFENNSGSPILDDAAVNAVANSTAAGTGNYQRYSSRFDYIYPKDVCAQAGSPPGTSTLTPGGSPSETLPSPLPGANEAPKAVPSAEPPKSKTPAPKKSGAPVSEPSAPGNPLSNPAPDNSEPTQPQPAEFIDRKPITPPDLSPLTEPTEPNGAAADLVPLEPVTPAPIAPGPVESAPALPTDLNLPTPEDDQPN